MAGARTVTMKNTALCGILVCVLQLVVSSTTPNTNQGNPSQCPQKLNTCQCLYGDSDDVIVDNEEETRTVGLAAATGALGGILATGTALAAYMHFRGGGGGGGGGGQGGGSPGAGGGGGGGGGGSSGNRGDWRAPRYSRPDSSASSFDSSDSQNPLTGRSDRPDTFNMETRGRPFTTATTTSSVTNIYRHGKVWPAQF